MDFENPEKMKVITGMIDEFVDRELIPLEPEFLSRSFRDLLPVLEEKRAMVKQMELWAPNHPKEYGGMGLNLVEHAFVSESLGRTPLGHYVFGCQAPDAGNIEILHLYGTDEQKAADFIAQYMTKPVVGFIAGRKAPEGRTMGHAGAIVEGGVGTADEKIARFQEVGVRVAETPEQISDLFQKPANLSS